MQSDSRARSLIGAAVFVLTCAWLGLMIAHRFSLTFDEGIYVDASRRILAGQVPYRDFFVVMGPGTFWLQALALRLFGMTLAASRAILILDLAILATCVFWLVSRVRSVGYAAWIAAFVVILETATPGITIPSHRWDSAACALVAITICASASNRLAILVTGCAAAFAAWITPPVALVAVAILIWLSLEQRTKTPLFLAGAAAVSIVCTAVLAIQGALRPMLHQLLWNGSHYAGANYLPYGTLFGRGYGQFFDGATLFEWPIRAIVVLGIMLPILLPPVAILCFRQWRKTAFLRLLFLGGIALVISTFPRMDLPHLTYCAPVFYALLAILAASIPLPKVRAAILIAATLLAAVYTFNAVVQHSREISLETNIGTVRALPEDLVLVRGIQSEIPRGTSLFVFPYLPIANFFTLSPNPTRYSYLQPGMMSDQDEAAALAELRRSPPARILYFDFPEKELLSIWPASNPARLRFRHLESYIAANYHRVGAIDTSKRAFEVLEPNE